MISLKILAVLHVLALTLIVAIVSFLYYVAYRPPDADLAGFSPVHRRPDAGRRGVPSADVFVSSFGFLVIADWLMGRLYSLKYSCRF